MAEHEQDTQPMEPLVEPEPGRPAEDAAQPRNEDIIDSYLVIEGETTRRKEHVLMALEVRVWPDGTIKLVSAELLTLPPSVRTSCRLRILI